MIEALGRIETEEAVEALLACYEQAQDAIRRVKIIQALGSSSNRDVKPLLLTAAIDQHTWVRSAAIYALRNFPDPDTLPILLQALEDPDPAVQFSAVRCLRQRSDIEIAIPGLIMIMQSDELYTGTWRYEEELLEISERQAA